MNGPLSLASTVSSRCSAHDQPDIPTQSDSPAFEGHLEAAQAAVNQQKAPLKAQRHQGRPVQGKTETTEECEGAKRQDEVVSGGLVLFPFVDASAVSILAILPPCGGGDTIVSSQLPETCQSVSNQSPVVVPAESAGCSTPEPPAAGNCVSGSHLLKNPDTQSVTPALRQTEAAPLALHAAAASATEISTERQITEIHHARDLAIDGTEAEAEMAGPSAPESGKKTLESKESVVSSGPRAKDLRADGIRIAKRDTSMKDVVELENSSGLAEKNLPSPDAPLARSAKRDLHQFDERRVESNADAARVSTPHISFAASVTPASPCDKTDQVFTSHTTSPVDRLASALLDGVAQLRFAREDSVAVVLKPEAGTELLLRVEMRDGGVSAHLEVEHGDRAFLDQHWSELQDRLAEQGVSLQRATQFTSGGHQFRHARQDHPAFAVDEDIFAGPMTQNSQTSNPTPVRRIARGFETWA